MYSMRNTLLAQNWLRKQFQAHSQKFEIVICFGSLGARVNGETGGLRTKPPAFKNFVFFYKK